MRLCGKIGQSHTRRYGTEKTRTSCSSTATVVKRTHLTYMDTACAVKPDSQRNFGFFHVSNAIRQ
jgi:hypothetical protein